MKKTTIWVVLCFANLFHPVAAVENDSNYKNLTGKQRLELITRLFEKSKSGSVLSTTEQNFLKHYLTPKENLVIIDLRMKLRKEKGIDLDFYRQSNDLSKCNIRFEHYPFFRINSNLEPTSSNYCGLLNSPDPEIARLYRKRARLRFLKRLDDDRCVAVIEVLKNKPTILNPIWEYPEFSPMINYGPIPTVENMSIKQADVLWGQGSSKSNSFKNKRTYKLVSGHPLQGHKRAYYFIDLVFELNRIKKYRIRSTEISHNNNWVFMRKEKEEDKTSSSKTNLF